MKEKLRLIWRISFALVLALILTITTLGGIAGLPVQYLHAAGGTFGGGTGTPGDPYMIEDVADLQATKNNLTAYYALSNDIDASATSGWNGGQGFEPIGDVDNRFSGGFDGGGHNITGLYINRPDTNNVGLFGHVGDDTGATVIKGVHLVNTTVIGARGTGTLIGRVTGNANTLIEECSAVGGSVIGNGATGGLIGSFNSWRITPGGTDNPIVHYSYTDVAVYSSASGGGRDKFGGLVGCSQKGTIQNSYSRSSVTVTNGSRIGGLAGCIDLRGEILDSYSTGLVSVTNCVSVGGLVGNRIGPGGNFGVVINSFWDTETSGQATSAGGTGKTTSQMKTKTTFTDAGWNFDDIWDIDSLVNDGYPYLVWTGFTPTELTITGTFTAKDKTYDGTNDAEFDTYNLALSGVLGGDSVNLIDVVIRFSNAYAEDDKIVNITSAVLAGTDAGKYILSLVGAPTATADIIRKSLVVTADDKSKVYDGDVFPEADYTVSYAGFVNGEDEGDLTGELTFAGTAIEAIDVGTYNITAEGLISDNYDITAINGTLEITVRPITVTADDKSKQCSCPEPKLTWQITEGEMAIGDAFIGELEREPGDAIGTYAILQGTLSIDDDNNGDNYNLTFVEGTLTITVGSTRFFLPCFIATAAYGTPMAEEIQILREFRDECMLTNPLGKTLVEFYYEVSPPIAEFITEHPSLKPIVRAGLLPVVAMSAVVVKTSTD
jgi:hypothetical protein